MMADGAYEVDVVEIDWVGLISCLTKTNRLC